MNKEFITPTELYTLSLQLVEEVRRDGFSPDVVIGLWRGGAVPTLVMTEALHECGVNFQHYPIKAQHTTMEGAYMDNVRLTLPEGLGRYVQWSSQVLVVDDVFETGYTVEKVKLELESRFGVEWDNVKVATIWYKPEKRKVSFKPDFYVALSDNWLVMPHELRGPLDD